MINFGKNRENGERQKTVFVVDEKNSPFMVTEAFRHLMTNVNFAIPKKENNQGKVVCISSSIQSEGKSTVSVNLALAFARSGAKTILVDCDMRKPAVKNYFKVKGNQGIIDCLSGVAEWTNVVERDEESGLDILFCRKTAPNPIFLLNNTAFSQLIQSLAAKYEYVIIDTSPIGIVADATVIGQSCDGVVCVTRQMYSNHKNIKETLRQLEFAGCKFLGFVLNGFTVSNRTYYSKKNYKYKYE